MPRQDFINQSGVLLLMQMMARMVQLPSSIILMVISTSTIQVLPVLCERLLESHHWPQHLMYPLCEVVDGFPLPPSLGLTHTQVIHHPF